VVELDAAFKKHVKAYSPNTMVAAIDTTAMVACIVVIIVIIVTALGAFA